jgi:hypothetical protein
VVLRIGSGDLESDAEMGEGADKARQQPRAVERDLLRYNLIQTVLAYLGTPMQSSDSGGSVLW